MKKLLSNEAVLDEHWVKIGQYHFCFGRYSSEDKNYYLTIDHGKAFKLDHDTGFKTKEEAVKWLKNELAQIFKDCLKDCEV